MKDKTERKFGGRLPTEPSSGRGSGSYLSEETFLMGREQREAEEQGHRHLAKVYVREHEEPREGAGNEYQSEMKQHPWLDKQSLDGIDSDLNPKWDLNPEVRTELENELREQELEKQLKLGLNPKFSSTPEFKP